MQKPRDLKEKGIARQIDIDIDIRFKDIWKRKRNMKVSMSLCLAHKCKQRLESTSDEGQGKRVPMRDCKEPNELKDCGNMISLSHLMNISSSLI